MGEVPVRQVMLQSRGPQPIRPGSLFVCKYLYWKHDPTPLVLVSGLYKDGRVAGVNLHNLTLSDMKSLIAKYCGKAFSYQGAVKGRAEIIKGFRTYRSDGLKQIKVLDCQYFLDSLGVVNRGKLLSPAEVQKVKQQVQQQLRQRINPKADDLTTKSSGTIPGKPATIPGIPVGQNNIGG